MHRSRIILTLLGTGALLCAVVAAWWWFGAERLAFYTNDADVHTAADDAAVRFGEAEGFEARADADRDLRVGDLGLRGVDVRDAAVALDDEPGHDQSVERRIAESLLPIGAMTNPILLMRSSEHSTCEA